MLPPPFFINRYQKRVSMTTNDALPNSHHPQGQSTGTHSEDKDGNGGDTEAGIDWDADTSRMGEDDGIGGGDVISAPQHYDAAGDTLTALTGDAGFVTSATAIEGARAPSKAAPGSNDGRLAYPDDDSSSSGVRRD